jgi:Methyltransferase domain
LSAAYLAGSTTQMDLGFRIRELTAKAGIAALKASGFYDGYWAHWRGPIFDYAEAKGIHIMPVHYYSPIPAMNSGLHPRKGLPIDVDASVEKLNALFSKYGRELCELFGKEPRGPTDYDPKNGGYGTIDAAALYGTVRETRPKRIVEIGSGSSTLVTAAAIETNQAEDSGYSPIFICIEPFLPEYLKGGVPGVSQFIEKPLQDVPLDLFTGLEAGDILFIDSTHVVSFGSDVLYEYLTILPALPPGVLVHIHDIFLPNDYPESWLKRDRFFWNEQYLLEAFLAMNSSYKIEFAVNAAAERVKPWPCILDYPADVYSVGFWIRRT